MPAFVAALAAAMLFCAGMLVFNVLTRLAQRLHWAPADLSENGFLQFGLALTLSGVFWRMAARHRIL